jgi:hypothetical protein
VNVIEGQYLELMVVGADSREGRVSEDGRQNRGCAYF